MEASAIQGPSSLSRQHADLAVNILVFDNHAEIAKQLKVRGTMYLTHKPRTHQDLFSPRLFFVAPPTH